MLTLLEPREMVDDAKFQLLYDCTVTGEFTKWIPRRVCPPLARNVTLSMFHIEVCVMTTAAVEKTIALTSSGVKDET